MTAKATQINQLNLQQHAASRPVSQFQRHGASRPVWQDRRAYALPLRGSVLISVMVVLLIVGLLISQTLQTLLLVRRGDDARANLRQARELVELGKIVLQQNPAARRIAEVHCGVKSHDKSHLNRSDSGSIDFEQLSSVDDGPPQIRISVTYRVGSNSEITATHIVDESE